MVEAFGVQVAQVAFAAAGLAASTNYEWYLTAIVEVRAAGSSGTIDAWLSGTLSAFGTNLNPGTGSSQAAGLTGATSDTTVNNAAASTIGLQAEWANSETGQAMTCFGSILETMQSLF